MKKNLSEIIAQIKECSEKIFEEIKQEEIDFYCFIQSQFKKAEGNVRNNVLFKRLFKLRMFLVF